MYAFHTGLLSCLNHAFTPFPILTFNFHPRRICNEEDEDVLSSATSAKEVPAEVRDWLASTFTRSLSNMKKREDKLHFRSVANAIRAGIVVDR